MDKVLVHPSQLQGVLSIPSSKSQTMRALLFALMAQGKSCISDPLISPDTEVMLEGIRHFGAKVEREEGTIVVEGVGGQLKPAEDVIQCGNSGQVLRFLGALAALLPTYTILTGDASIRHNRPVQPLLDGLQQLGAFAVSSRLDGQAPILIRGPLKGGKAVISGEDSQPVSGLLMLGAFSPLELEVLQPGEKPWVNLTLSWLDRFGIRYENDHFKHYRMYGEAALSGFEYRVPGDFGAAAFPIAAALITGSELILDNLHFHDAQGDRALLSILESMGASFSIEGSQLRVKRCDQLQGRRIDVNDVIDALPILAVIASFAKGKTELVNGAIARKKESDRISGIALELRKMGGRIEETPDGLTIHPAKLRGSQQLQTHSDHRLALALSVAAMAAEGQSAIHGVRCIAKSYPSFFADLQKMGAQVELV